MAIQTTMAKGYAARMLFIAILCAVFGVWGIIDYVWVIPGRQRAYERFKVVEAAKSALEASVTDPANLPDSVKNAQALVDAEWAKLTGKPKSSTSEQEMTALLAGPHGKEYDFWAAIWISLPMLRTPPLDDEAEQPLQVIYTAVTNELNLLGTPEQPSAFDRATQWFFIASLPFAPWFFWMFIKARKQHYRLDDDGTLSFVGDPQLGTGAWTAAEIADIDMSRWMAKSIAWAVKSDGTRLKLDAYVHKNLHLIIGAIASQKYPLEWDAEAKPVKKDSGDAPTETAEATAGAESQ